MTTMRYGDLIADMLVENQRRISDLERVAGVSQTPGPLVNIEDIRRELNLLWDRDVIYGSWIDSDELIKSSAIKTPFEVIYSQVLTTDQASITIDIPGKYRHLMLEGAGRVTTATGGNVWAQFNGDQGHNYRWAYINTDGLVVDQANDTVAANLDIFAALGQFAQSDAGAGVSGNFSCTIQHYRSALYKNLISHSIEGQGLNYYGMGSIWENVNPITSIRLSATDSSFVQDSANFAAGFSISAYGLL